MTLSAVVLAAGKGTRMRSDLPKPLHLVRGRPLLAWVVDALALVEPTTTVMVVGHGSDQVTSALQVHFADRSFVYAEQVTQRGTGDAAGVGLAALDAHDGGYDDDDDVLVLPGDTPLLKAESIAALVAAHRENGAAATIVTTRMSDPTGYGRVLRTDRGAVEAIVEERDASDDQRTIDEVNAGMYCYRRSMLTPALRMIDTNNAQGELYLTDVVGVLAESGHTVQPFPVAEQETAGVNDRSQLVAASQLVGDRIIDDLLRSGVTVIAPAATVIDATVVVEPDVTILPGCVIEGSTHIGSGAVIGPSTRLNNTTVGEGAVVEASTVSGAVIAPNQRVGPYEHITAAAGS